VPTAKQRKKALKAKNIQAKRMAKWRREQGEMPPVLSPHRDDEMVLAGRRSAVMTVDEDTKITYTPELVRSMKKFVDEMVEASEEADRAEQIVAEIEADIAANGPSLPSVELQAKIEAVLANTTKTGHAAPVVDSSMRPIVGTIDTTSEQVEERLRAHLVKGTKDMLLDLAQQRGVHVASRWTKDKIIDALMAAG
jgi:hypothetical protein